MIVDPATIDAYLAKRGLISQISDLQWETLLQTIEERLGRDLCYRCRLITQTDDVLGRYYTGFPGTVPRPYRHIRCLEILAFESDAVFALQKWMTEQDIRWENCSQLNDETDQIESVGFRITGYE